jgi:hypothetical protein
MPIKTYSHEERKDIFEAHLKDLLRLHYEMGNLIQAIKGECNPSDYGYLDDADIAAIIERAAKAMAQGDGGSYLYHHPPLPEELKAALDNLDNEYQQLKRESENEGDKIQK